VRAADARARALRVRPEVIPGSGRTARPSAIGQVSALYGAGEAQTIENCGTTVIFRCSASEGGGTARFASKLIGEREVIRTQVSTSRGGWGLFSGQKPHKTVTTSEQHTTESAVMASEIEQLRDGVGFLQRVPYTALSIQRILLNCWAHPQGLATVVNRPAGTFGSSTSPTARSSSSTATRRAEPSRYGTSLTFARGSMPTAM
jgi:Type IV secretion-system coupling protein DNA-binding domain